MNGEKNLAVCEILRRIIVGEDTAWDERFKLAQREAKGVPRCYIEATWQELAGHAETFGLQAAEFVEAALDWRQQDLALLETLARQHCGAEPAANGKATRPSAL